MAKTALITGASSGIGEQFAIALAKQGYQLVLVARNAQKLAAVAADITAQFPGRRVSIFSADLAQPNGATALTQQLQAQGLVIDMLVNNAGVGDSGAFAKCDIARQAQMIQLNITALTELTHAWLPAMLARKQGAIINVASLAGFQPTPYMGVYGASKSYVLSFTESLWAECRGKGVKILALCPGPVDTPFFEAADAGPMRSKVPAVVMATAPQVVAAALAGLAKGKSVVVPGASSQMGSLLPRFLPRSWVARSSALIMGR